MSSAPDSLTVTTNRTGWVWAGLLGLLGLASAVDAFSRGYGSVGLAVLVWTLLLVWLVLLVFVFPRLIIDNAGATVRNVIYSVRIPWARLKDARNAMFVELVPDDGVPVRVWAAPQSAMKRGRQTLRNKARIDQRVQEGPVAKGDVAGGVLVERDRAMAASRTSPERTAGPVTRTFLKRDWAIAGALLVAAAVSLLMV